MNEDDNLSEEGLEDPYEKELREAQEQANQRNEEGFKDLTEGKIRRKRTGEDDEQLELPLESRNVARVGAGLAFEVGANSILDFFSLVPGSQAAGSAVINAIAQGIRGGKFSFGEVLGSAAASQIPGLAQGKAITTAGKFTKAAATGAVSGGIEATSIAAVDRGELPTIQELGLAIGAGGILGAGFQKVGDELDPKVRGLFQDLKARVNGNMTPFELAGSVGAARAVNPKDVPRNTIDSWRTVGRKSQPLNFLFGDKAGWRKGRLNLKSWRERGADKNIAEQFLTAQGKGVVFSSEANKQNAFMSRIFGIEGAEQLLNLPKGSQRIFQAHHKTATKAVLTGQEGLIYDSPYYHEIQKVWEDLELTLGNNPDNIIGTLGLVQRDLNSPHSLIHKFLDSKMGPDGTKFWTEDLMKQIVIYDDAGNAIGHKNFDLRLEKTKDQAVIFKEAVDLLKLAHRQFYLAKGVKPGEYLTTEPILDEEIVDSFINKLPPKGGTGQYTTDVISRIAREVAQETDIKPAIPSFSFKQLIEEVADKNVKNQLDDMYRFAVNQANGEDMLIEVIFNNMKPKDAIKKYRGNDPAAAALAKELSDAVKYNRQALKQLYQTKFGEIPPAVTKFDKGADE